MGGGLEEGCGRAGVRAPRPGRVRAASAAHANPADLVLLEVDGELVAALRQQKGRRDRRERLEAVVVQAERVDQLAQPRSLPLRDHARHEGGGRRYSAKKAEMQRCFVSQEETRDMRTQQQRSCHMSAA